jgi:hypothetical protein
MLGEIVFKQTMWSETLKKLKQDVKHQKDYDVTSQLHKKLKREFQEQKAVEEKNYKEGIYKRNKDSFRMSDKLLNM